MRRPVLAAFLLCTAGIALAPRTMPLAADDATAAAGSGSLRLKGYVNARYAYVGSSSAATVYSGARITGSLKLSALAERVVLTYRSHHWLAFDRPSRSLYGSSFENRHVLQTVSIEARDLFARGLSLELGRFFPTTDYAASPVIDGGAATLRLGRFTLGGAAGRIVDVWDNGRESSDLLASGRVKLETARLGAAVGFQSAEHAGRREREASAGCGVSVTKDIRLDVYGAYDFEAAEASRSGAGASIRREAATLAISASRWRNPFDQLSLADKGRSIEYWGLYSKDVPSTYNDIRVSGSYGRSSWSVRGSAGSMSGVRTGWTANAYLTSPALRGFRGSAGVQGMRTDFIDFYSIEGSITRTLGAAAVEIKSQTRSYQWRPRPSGFRNMDNYTEVSAEYPLRRHIYMSAAVGGFFRTLGNEGFKPQAEMRVIARI